MRKTFSYFFRLLLFLILTLVTQIGGIVYFISLIIAKRWKVKFRAKSLLIFIGLYLTTTFLIVPNIAPLFGREKVVHTQLIQPTNYMTVLLNRNYVKPELNKLLLQTATHLEGSTIKIHYLDANFPFINQFPLFPHLSHNDGKKIDLSLIYETPEGEISHQQKSVSGYGVFEGFKSGEPSQLKECMSSGYFQYDMTKFLTFGEINSDLHFSRKGTKKLIESILNNDQLGKLFIEPHLKQRLTLSDDRIRNHGCKAVRHDDHIHIQLK